MKKTSMVLLFSAGGRSHWSVVEAILENDLLLPGPGRTDHLFGGIEPRGPESDWKTLSELRYEALCHRRKTAGGASWLLSLPEMRRSGPGGSYHQKVIW